MEKTPTKHNVTRASNDTGISAEHVKYQFWEAKWPLKPSRLPPRLLLLRWLLHAELLPRPSAAAADNVIMVRESLLSNLSPPRDERTLRERVKHHTPEHLSVFFTPPPFQFCSTPVTQDAGGSPGGEGAGQGGGKDRAWRESEV